MKTPRTRTGGRGVALAVVVLGAVIAAAQPHGSRLTPEEIADPLAPWTLEASGPTPVSRVPNPGPVVAPIVPDDAPRDATTEPERQPETSQPLQGDEVAVVHCRQISLGNPEHARRLAELLRAGATLEDAGRALGGVEWTERERDYALEDLEADLRAEIESLPDGGWTRPRTWRGRSILVQVVSRTQRSRRALPVLGQGLSPEERDQLTARFRLNKPPPTRPQNPEETAMVQPAAVLEQATPETPADVQEGGEVVVVVSVGREGEAVDVRVQHATNPALEAAAINAARSSRYRAATRLGIPEPGTVTLTFRFASPGAPANEPGGD